jgi:nucleotide-binding universal stress UspA family protein
VDRAGFGRIICVADSSVSARTAQDQATVLAGPEDTLTVVAVADVREASRDAGLLVVGAHVRFDPDGIPPGRLASSPEPGSPVAVLTARGHSELGFPGLVLIGTQGSEDQHAVVVAATIAARHDTRVVLAHVGQPDPALRLTLAEQAADVLAITGRVPAILSVAGLPVDRLTAMASSIGAGLVVLGSRCPQALAGVSSSVACRASCSVLVLPAENYAPFPDVHSSIDVPDPDGPHPPNK